MTPQLQTPPWQGTVRTIPKSWMDINGHMNMKYYFQVVEEALDEVILPDFQTLLDDQHELQFWTTETELFYKKEMFADQQLVAHIFPITRSDTELEFLGKVISVGDQLVESADCFLVGHLRDKNSGEEVPLSPGIMAMFDAKLEEVEHPIGKPIFPAPHVLTHTGDSWHTSAEGIAESDFVGDPEHIGLAEHLDIFDRAAVGMFAELARQVNVFAIPGMGGFVLSNYIQYNDKLKPGDNYHTRSRVHALRRKTVTFQHELYRDPGYENHIASWRHTMTFIDMNKRKSIPVPDLFKETIEAYYKVALPKDDK